MDDKKDEHGEEAKETPSPSELAPPITGGTANAQSADQRKASRIGQRSGSNSVGNFLRNTFGRKK